MQAPLIIRLTPTENNEPGHALLRLPDNWKGAQNPLYLTIQNTNTNEYLHPATDNTSNWEAASCEWKLTGFEEINGLLELKIGPDIVDPLLESSQESPNYAITLRDDEGYSRSLGQLSFSTSSHFLPSSAKSDTEQRSATPSPHPAEEVISAPPMEPGAIEEPEEAIEPETMEPEPTKAIEPPPPPTPPTPPTAAETKKPSNKALLLLLLGLFLALGLISAGAWWWLNKADNKSTPDTALVASACDANSMNKKTDLEFIQSCLEEKPDSGKMLQIIEQAKKAGHCSIAQRLYANRSQAGDVAIASAYVKEYDPKFHKKSDCFAEPNIATATYWYETILANDPENKVAQQRLEELK